MAAAKDVSAQIVRLFARFRGRSSAPVSSIGSRIHERCLHRESTVLNNAHYIPQGQLYTSKASYGTPALDHSLPLSPAVRYLVYTHNVDLSRITATGPGRRLLKGDVLQYIQDVKDGKVTQQVPVKSAQPVELATPSSQSRKPPKQIHTTSSSLQAFTDLSLDSERVAAARRLTQYKTTTPYSYASVSCGLNRVLELSSAGNNFDLTAFFVKAAALTLQRVPQSNCVWSGNDVEPLSSINVSIVSGGGVLRVNEADRHSLQSISRMIRDGDTNSQSSEATSISISHLDALHITHFTSVIHPSQSSTLSIGSTQTIPNEQGPPSKRVTATLTADARVIGYELSCQWLETFCSIVEAPDTNGLL